MWRNGGAENSIAICFPRVLKPNLGRREHRRHKTGLLRLFWRGSAPKRLSPGNTSRPVTASISSPLEFWVQLGEDGHEHPPRPPGRPTRGTTCLASVSRLLALRAFPRPQPRASSADQAFATRGPTFTRSPSPRCITSLTLTLTHGSFPDLWSLTCFTQG